MTSEKEDPKPSAKIYTVSDLLRHTDTKQTWIIQDLLKIGDQMLLSAAPKTGKSLLAAEIAVELARPFGLFEKRYLFAPKKDGQAIGKTLLQIHKPEGKASWKVLFFSLEMREGLVGGRLKMQLHDYFDFNEEKLEKGEVDPAQWNLDLVHVFGLPGSSATTGLEYTRQNLEILQSASSPGGVTKTIDGRDAQTVHEIIKEQKPDVVVFDTLIQLHSINENDNVQMKQVLQKIRDITCRPKADSKGMEQVAHIIAHHTRKESAGQREPLSPEMMRGAGSVHGAADVVLLSRLKHRDNSGTRILEMHVSSRSSDVENFFLKRTKNLTHNWHELTEIEKAGKQVQKNRCFQAGIMALLKNIGDEGVVLNHSQLLEEAESQRKAMGATCKIPSGTPTVTTQVETLLKTGKIEFAVALPSVKADLWQVHPLREKMDKPKAAPAAAIEVSISPKPKKIAKRRKLKKRALKTAKKKISHSK